MLIKAKVLHFKDNGKIFKTESMDVWSTENDPEHKGITLDVQEEKDNNIEILITLPQLKKLLKPYGIK